MSSKLKPAVFVVFVVLALIPARARAQQTLGAINGTVTDQSGAVVQNVDVKIRNVATNLEVNAKTKNDGSFTSSICRSARMR